MAPESSGIVTVSKISWMAWIMLGPRMCQFRWKKIAWFPSRPGAIKGGSEKTLWYISSSKGVLESLWCCSRRGLF